MQTVENVKRSTPPSTLTANAVSQAFAGPEGHVANADGNGAERILLKVDRVVAPAFFAEAADAAAIKEQISEQLKNDLLADLQSPASRHAVDERQQRAFQQLTGQAQTQ